MGNREDKYAVFVIAQRGNDVRNLGVFDTFEGGETEAEDTKYARGGLSPHESLGGRREVGNVTVARLYDSFIQAQEPWLDAGVGVAEMTVVKQPLDDDGSVYGRPRVYKGKLVTLTPPDHDSESSDAAQIELVVAPRGGIG